MAEFDASKTWLGVGAKGGGMLFVVGMEDTEGCIWHLTTPARNWFSLTSVRLGLGLGGSVGMVAMCVFNCDSAKVRLDKTELTDWGINVSMGGKWKDVAKALKNAGFWTRIAKIGASRGTRKAIGGALHGADEIREDLHFIYNGLDIGSMDGKPKVVVIDSPVGAGLELSATYSMGTIEIY